MKKDMMRLAQINNLLGIKRFRMMSLRLWIITALTWHLLETTAFLSHLTGLAHSSKMCLLFCKRMSLSPFSHISRMTRHTHSFIRSIWILITHTTGCFTHNVIVPYKNVLVKQNVKHFKYLCIPVDKSVDNLWIACE